MLLGTPTMGMMPTVQCTTNLGVEWEHTLSELSLESLTLNSLLSKSTESSLRVLPVKFTENMCPERSFITIDQDDKQLEDHEDDTVSEHPRGHLDEDYLHWTQEE